jgi:hypothetical protein
MRALDRFQSQMMSWNIEIERNSTMDIIGSVTGAINTVLKAKELADKLKNLELKELIVELQSKLLDLKVECLNLREENLGLAAEIKRLSAPPEVDVKNGMYYRVSGGDGPFCTACHDTKGQMVRLAETGDDVRMMTNVHWKCPSCTARFVGH